MRWPETGYEARSGNIVTIDEVWTSPAGRGARARYTKVVRYTARAGESVPIELNGDEHGQVAVADLVGKREEGRQKTEE
jgi:hypothetical protein